MPKKWFPLENNPEVMADYVRRMGADGGSFDITDVLGFDEELLALVPQPVKAVMLLYPISSEIDASAQAAAVASKESAAEAIKSGLWYTHQTVGNACGTIALIHASINAILQGQMTLVEESNDVNSKTVWLRELLQATAEMTPAERARFIEESTDLEALHVSAADQGQSRQEALDADIDLHFVTFVSHNGKLWELDGRATGPILRSERCPPDALLEESAKAIKQYITAVAEKNPTNAMMFAATALL